MAKKPIPLPVVVEEEPEDECPKCPPVGAPAWMATFADIATLLMAFFVLILSFAEFNQPKFKMVAGSLRNSFGVQRDSPAFEQPKGTTLLDLKFSPSPEASILPEITQQTTDTDRPEIDKAAPDGDAGTGELAQALEDAIDMKEVEVSSEEGEIVVSVSAAAPETAREAVDKALEAISQAKMDDPDQAEKLDDVRFESDAATVSELARATEAEPETNEMMQSPGTTPSSGGAGDSERTASIAEAELRVSLREEISEGLVSVEQREDKVIVTVGAGGTFASGDATLTREARDIMARLAFSTMDDASKITVTGHTDDRPLGAGSRFGDNWGLAAARSAAVVRELSAQGLIDPDRLIATSRGESNPIANNRTELGRALNRRIEIEIDY